MGLQKKKTIMSSTTETSGHMNGTCLEGNQQHPASPKIGTQNGGDKFSSNNHAEATDDVKATQQHIKNLETDLRHARDALSGL